MLAAVCVAALSVGVAPAADSGPTALTFSPSTSLGGAVRATWGFRFTAEGPLDASHPVTITAPNAAFTKSSQPDATFTSMVDLTTGQDDTNGANVSSGTTATLVPSHPIPAGDVVALSMIRVINPGSGTPFSSISISEGGTTLHPGAGSFGSGAQPVGDLEFSPSTTAGGATDVTWGYRFRLSSTGRLPERSEITVTAPAGGSFGLGHFTLVDLSTFTNRHSDIGDTVSADGGTATINIGSAFSPGDLLQIEFTGTTNPAAGVPFSTAAVTTDADTVPAHPGAGAFTAPSTVSGVTFTVSSTAGGASANWGTVFGTSATGRLLDGATVVLGVPAGATMPTANGSYTLRDATTGAGYNPHSVTVGSTSVTLTLALRNLDVIRAGDQLTLDVHGVTNPAGGVSPAKVSIATGSDPTPVTATAPAAAAPSATVSGVRLWETTLAANATQVVWGARFRVSAAGALTGNSGTVTFSGPAGTFPSNPFTVIEDLTSGAGPCGGCTAVQSADGSSVTVKPNFSISPGDVVVLEAHGVTNPGAGGVTASGFGIATSSDTTVAHPPSGVTFTAPQAPAAVTVFPSTSAAGATHTAWTTLFTASATGGIADDGRQPAEIQLTLPPGTTVENGGSFGVYDLTSGAFQESGGSATVGAGTASFFIPSAISPGDELALVLAGVTNPAAGDVPGSAVSVSTSSDSVPASAGDGLSFLAQSLPHTDLLNGTDPAGSATDDQLSGEFTTSPTGQLASSAGRYGTVTLTAPAGTEFSGSNCFQTFDLTTGLRGCAVSTADSVSGSSYTVKPGFSIGAGDLIAFSVKATNPASGLVPPTGFRMSTSSDNGSPSTTGEPVTGVEGKSLTEPVLVVDGSCPASASIDWGDGSASSVASISCEGLIATLTGTHTYQENGSYTVTAQTDDSVTGSTTATISDAPISVSAGTGLTATAGAPFTGVVARFTDSNPFGKTTDFTATVDWGDGTSSAGTITLVSGKFFVHGTHTYTKTGNLAVKVTVTGNGGSDGTVVESLTVNAPDAPTVTLTQPKSGTTLTTATPTFAGTAGTAPADAPQITVKLYSGGAVAGSPVQTLSATTTGGAWSVATSAALANGTYTAQAQQSTTTGVTGLSGASVFKINAPPPTPPPPPPGPTAGGGPPAGCQQQATFGPIAAVGCLQTVLDASQIPAAEKRALCKVMDLGSQKCDRELAKEVKRPAQDPLIAQAVVRVNGLDLTPRAGSVVLFAPKARAVIASNALVQILGDRVTLHSGAITLSKTGDVPDLDAELDKLIGSGGLAAEALKLGGFHLTGTLSVTLVKHATKLEAAVALPNLFSAVGGGSLTAQAKGTADNGEDVQFNELRIKASPMNFGGFQLKNASFCYQNHISDNFCEPAGFQWGTSDVTLPTWNATAKVSVLGVTLDAAPPPPTYGIGFVGGNFAFGGAAARIKGPGIPLGGAVSLTSFGGSFAVNPVRATGEVGLSVGDVATINGSLFFVVPTGGQTYTFGGTELGSVIKPPLALPKVTVNNFALAAGGDVGLKIPGFDKPVPLADGYLVYAYPSYIAAGGGFNVNLFNGALIADGGLQGALNFGNGMFDIEGAVGLAVNAGPLQAGFDAQAVVSNVGIAGCGSVNAFGASTAAGIGYKWGQGFDGVNVMVGSCDLTPYRVVVSASSALASARGRARVAAGTVLRVPSGEPNEMVKLVGSGGPPDITIAGPGGASASTAGRLSAQSAPFLIKRDPRDSTTCVAILHPPAGSYSITANPGSPAITSVLSAHGFTPGVKAHVSGRGAKRRLSYRVASEQPGEAVTFVERGQGVDKLIGTAKKGHGVLRFTPAAGPGGVRQIVATATESGMPIVLSAGSSTPGQKVVAKYRAPGPAKLGRARSVHARRTGSHLTVSFMRVHGAHRYVVRVDLRSGMHSDYVIKRTSVRIMVPTVGPAGGTVTVRALGDGLKTVDGRPVKAKVTTAKHKRHHRRTKHRHKH